MPVIKPITELRNTNEISELCHQQQEPIFITKNGFGDLVVMSIEAYDKLMSEKIIDRASLASKSSAPSATSCSASCIALSIIFSLISL